MKIYTKAGDDGSTGLLGPGRLRKDHHRIEAYGTVDELNAALGVARSHAEPGSPVDEELASLQDELFAVGAALADPDPAGRFHDQIAEPQIARLEARIDALEAELPPLRQFILPAGPPDSAAIHAARTVCRRAERRVVTLADQPGEHVPAAIVVYLNRLSDLLFVLARAANRAAGRDDVLWDPSRGS